MKGFKQFLTLLLTLTLLFGICGVAEDTEVLPAQIEETLEPIEEEQLAAPAEEAPAEGEPVEEEPAEEPVEEELVEEAPAEEVPAEEEPAEESEETLVEEPEAEESFEVEQLDVEPCPEDEHDFDWDNPVYVNEAKHGYRCTICGEIGNELSHTADCNEPTLCKECGGYAGEGSEIEHAYVPESERTYTYKDNDYHAWICTRCGGEDKDLHVVHCTQEAPYTCEICKHEVEKDVADLWHECDYDHLVPYDEHTHGHKCTLCGYVEPGDSIEGYKHWAWCDAPGVCVDCGAEYPDMETRHDMDNGVCTRCGYKEGESVEPCPDGEHDIDYENYVPINEEYHAHVCKKCGYYEEAYEHYAYCTDPTKCYMCGATFEPDPYEIEHPHEYDDDQTYTYEDDSFHIWTCPDCKEQVEEYHDIPCTQKAPYTCTVCKHTVKNPEYISHDYDWSDYKSDDTYHWHICKTCGEEVEKYEHRASCDNLGICEECGAAYSGPNVMHDFDRVHPLHDEESHWYICRNCKEESEHEEHTASCLHPDVCEDCRASSGIIIGYVSHDESYWFGPILGSDADQHWRKCNVCGELNYEEHYVPCDDKSGKCECGKATSNVDHDYESYYDGPIVGSDANRHWRKCDICGALNYQDHWAECGDADSLCECGRPATRIVHDYDWDSYEYDELSHWRMCKICKKKVSQGSHWIRCTDSEKESAECISCGALVKPDNAEVAHGDFLGEVTYQTKNSKYHTVICGLCGEKTTERHYVTCTSKTQKVCMICGAKKCSPVKDHDYDFVTTVSNEKQCGSYCAHCKKNFDMHDHYVTCDSDGRCVSCGRPVPEATVYHSYRNGVCIYCGSGIVIECPKTLTLTVKDTRTLKPMSPNDGQFTYKPTNPTIVSVSKKGKISAKAVGETDITITGKETKQTATCHVIVKPSTTKLTLSMEPNNLTPNIGVDYPQLKAIVEPADTVQEVTWKTSNANVSVTDDGTVLPMKPGKVTITATTKAVNKKGKALSKKITLTVVDPKLPTSVKIEQASPQTIYIGGEGIQLSAIVEPQLTASQAVTWSIPKKQQKYATIDPNTGKVTPGTKKGTVTVTVTTKDKKVNGKKATATIKIKVAKAP